MKSCKLPDSQEKRFLIYHLKEKIEECKNGIEASETSQGISQEEDRWWIKLRVYQEIFDMIR